MYTKRNVSPDAPGHWTSADGEYEFVRGANGWHAVHRAHWTGTQHENLPIGTARTLDAAMRIAARHAVTPVGKWLVPGPVLSN